MSFDIGMVLSLVAAFSASIIWHISCAVGKINFSAVVRGFRGVFQFIRRPHTKLTGHGGVFSPLGPLEIKTIMFYTLWTWF